MYLEYAKNEVQNSHSWIDTYNYLHERYGETWLFREVLVKHFGPKVGRKVVGFRLIFWVIVPVVLNGLVLLYLLISSVCSCCCRNDKEVEEKEVKRAKVEMADHQIKNKTTSPKERQ